MRSHSGISLPAQQETPGSSTPGGWVAEGSMGNSSQAGSLQAGPQMRPRGSIAKQRAFEPEV